MRNEETALIIGLCEVLGKIIDYKHGKKSDYRILVHGVFGDFDVDDLMEQANEYIIAMKSGKGAK